MDLFDIAAKITLNTSDYESGLKDAEGKGSSFADKLRGGLGKAARAIGAATKVAAAGVAAGMTAAIGLAKQATDAYANYEQLVGGAELLFGDAYSYIAEKAKTAYKDVQMSQNEYLQQVNGFAVGLKTALGGNEQAAAELAAKIVTAEADVVAATGNTQEAVQNAFNGIMKGNYTMLDNLQLGIKPTKEGMQEVIDKVNEWNEANGRATAYEIDNLADVQSALVDYIEMQGLAGYAANEASETIAGSAASAKAAWQDLLVAFASGDDISVAMDNVIHSVTAFAKNIIPAFSKALKGIGKAVRDIAPIIANELPGIIKEIVPIAIEIGMSLVNSVIDAFEQLFPMLVDLVTTNGQALIDTGMKLLMTVIQGIFDNLPALVDAAISIISQLATSIGQALPELIPAAFSIIAQLATSIGEALPELIPAAVSMVIQIVESLLDNIDLLIDAAIQLIIGLATGLIEAIPILLEKAPEIIVKLVQAIIRNAPKLLQAASTLISMIGQGIANAWEIVKGWGKDVISKISEGISSLWADVVSWGSDIINNIAEGLTNGISSITDIGKNIISGIWEGISGAAGWLWDKISGWATGLLNGIKGLFGIASPSKVFRDQIGKWLPLGLEEGFEDEMPKVENDLQNSLDEMAGKLNANISYSNGKNISNRMHEYDLQPERPIYLVLDSGELVGKIVQKMDVALGNENTMKLRFGGATV